jgi:L-lysine 6-transaminase
MSSAVATHDLKQRIKNFILADGYDIDLNIEKSHGSYLYDDKRNTKFLDMGSFYSSLPLGMNFDSLNTPEAEKELLIASKNKIANSDFYSQQSVEFMETFKSLAVPSQYIHGFFVEGGALAVENGMKAAFDWKVKKNFANGVTEEVGSQIMHFKQAFHGRSGYTLSVTNTADPKKHQYFPKFKWPRITNPKITFPLDNNLDKVIGLEEQAKIEIQNAFENNKADIAGILIEPIQGEGGDNHFRPEFFQYLREIANENEAMLIFDEVQTGIGITGAWWYTDHIKGAEPDIITFAKKMQMGGILVNKRIDEIENNVFKESSRINSTWGGALADMVRSKYILKAIDEENMIHNVNKKGNNLMNQLYELQENELISGVRGKGLFIAFDLESGDIRNNIVKELFKDNMVILGCGTNSLRFRPRLNITNDEIDLAVNKVEKALRALK